MTEGIADCMPLALRSVGDAIGLDSENRTKEAYCQYLSCMIYISQVLKDDAWDKDLQQVYNSDTAKLFLLLQQCQERAHTIISSFANDKSSPQTRDAQWRQGVQPRYCDSNTASMRQSDQSSLTPQSGVTHKLSESLSPASTLAMPTDDYLHLPSPPGSPMPCHRRTGSYDPLEKAYQENKQLITAYRARMLNANNGRRNQDVISKNLSLMRRMSENLVIAKAREQAIKKKLLERQQRLQEETNRRFGPVVLFTKEQQEQRVLYTKILEFEQETVWPKHLRERLILTPTDAKLIKEIITKIFSSSDHPLTQFLLQYQYHVYRKLVPLVKDVGDVKGKRKDSVEDSYIVLSETRSENEQPTDTIDILHVKESDEENELQSRRESMEKLPSDSVQEQTVNKIINDSVYDQNEETESSMDKNHQVESGGDGKKAVETSNCHDEDFSSSTDLEKLKNLLDENTTAPDSSQTMNTQGDESQNECKSDVGGDGMDEAAKLDIYFLELEDEMFGSESSGDEFCETENEGITKENNEDANSHMEELDHSMDVLNDGSSSSQLDSSEGRKENSVEETNGGDAKASKQVGALTEKDNEPPQSIETDKIERLSDDGNTLETNEHISNREDQFADEQRNSDSDHDAEHKQLETSTTDSNEETSPTPDSSEASYEDKGGQNEVEDQKVPPNSKLSPGEESSVDNKQEDDGAVPPGDEVRKQLKDILVDVRFFLEKLQKLLILAYEPLDTAAGRDLCYSCVEFPFFKPLWPMLLAVLRQVNYEKEICLADVMSANIGKGPLDLGVPKRLCLEDQKLLDSTGNNYPYQVAVEELHKVVTLFCPLEKLECLVRTSRCICQCVEDYWENMGKPRHSPETAIGCDDLLPILSYVIIQSGMTQLVSECDAMEEFIPEGYLMGEEGYCLTTLITALAYLATLKPT